MIGTLKKQDPREANMDMWNNQQGQQIYNEIRKEYPHFKSMPENQQKDIIAQKVVQKMKAGQLITDIDDTRRFENKVKNNPPYTPMRSIGGVFKNGSSTGFASSVDSSEHIFTPDEIDKMSAEEFDKNESAIMQQLKDGLIKNEQSETDFLGYSNPLTGSKQIFSREDIESMTNDEYTKNESAINAQLNSIGIPTNDELEIKTIFNGGTVYVNSYTRSNGTKVRGYYRAK